MNRAIRVVFMFLLLACAGFLVYHHGYFDGYRDGKVTYAFKYQKKRWLSKYGRELRP